TTILTHLSCERRVFKHCLHRVGQLCNLPFWHHQSCFSMSHIFGQAIGISTYHRYFHGLSFNYSIAKTFGNSRMKKQICLLKFHLYLLLRLIACKFNHFLQSEFCDIITHGLFKVSCADNNILERESKLHKSLYRLYAVLISLLPDKPPNTYYSKWRLVTGKVGCAFEKLQINCGGNEHLQFVSIITAFARPCSKIAPKTVQCVDIPPNALIVVWIF